MRCIELRPISDIVAEILKEAEREKENCVKRIDEYAKERVARVEDNRQAAALLDAAGIDLDLPHWTSGANLTVDLGFFAQNAADRRRMAEVFRTIRHTLDIKTLRVWSKDIADEKKKHVQIELRAEEWPGLTIKYQRKVKKNAKCRIVKKTNSYYTLVCDNPV